MDAARPASELAADVRPTQAVLAKCIGALQGLAEGNPKWEALLTKHDIPVNEATEALHAEFAERDALVARVADLEAEVEDATTQWRYWEEDAKNAIAERDRYREWISRIWTNAEQEAWDEQHGPDAWAIAIKREYSRRAEAAEAQVAALTSRIRELEGQ